MVANKIQKFQKQKELYKDNCQKKYATARIILEKQLKCFCSHAEISKRPEIWQPDRNALHVTIRLEVH